MMKFREKTALLFVIVFLIGTLSLSAAYLDKSAKLNEQLALANCKNELRILSTSLFTRLNAVSKYYNAFNAYNIGMYVEPYSAYYAGQGVYLQLTRDQEKLYSGFSEPVTLEASQDHAFLDTPTGTFLAYRDRIVLGGAQALELIVLWNMDYLHDFRSALLRFSIFVSVLSTLVIGFLGYILLSRLTKPLLDLGHSARRIADGNYQERVSIDSEDEIGQFARMFNLMADSVERQMHEMDDWVKERQQSIDHLSHEIRTPITAIIGYSQVLMHAKATDADKQKAAEYIGQQSMRLKLLSEKLLRLSRLHYDEVNLSPVKITQVIHAAQKTLQNLLNTKNMRIQLEMPDVQVLGDAVLLETLFQNLIENAVYASSQDQKIEIQGLMNMNILEVSIKDDGIGIEADDLVRITEPFVRVNAARSNQHSGAGIGLALCKRICELHQTKLEIESIPKMGTTVHIHFTIV